MSQILIDAMDSATPWTALAPDGTTPSTLIGLTIDATRFRYGPDRKSGRIMALAGATGHSVRRGLASLDLLQVDELRLWVQSDRTAPGSSFFLEVRLASAALPFEDPGNSWRSLVGIENRNAWERLRIDLGELPAAIRGAVDQVELRCVDGSQPFTVWVDDVIGVRDELIGDVEAALVARLENRVILGGGPVPAIVHGPDLPEPAPKTYLRVLLFDVRYSDERTSATRTRGDYTAAGYDIRPRSVAYDLYYQLDVFAETRADQARLLEFLLAELGPFGQLLVNDVQAPIELVRMPALEMLNGERTDRVGLLWKVLVREELGARERVRATQTVILDGDVLT